MIYNFHPEIQQMIGNDKICPICCKKLYFHSNTNFYCERCYFRIFTVQNDNLYSYIVFDISYSNLKIHMDFINNIMEIFDMNKGLNSDIILTCNIPKFQQWTEKCITEKIKTLLIFK